MSPQGVLEVAEGGGTRHANPGAQELGLESILGFFLDKNSMKIHRIYYKSNKQDSQHLSA